MNSTVWTVTGDPAAALDGCRAAMEGLGYSVTIDRDAWRGDAEVGSKAARALLGGFSRRHKVSFRVESAADGATYLYLAPAMTGAAGGALGYSKSKKEQASVVDAVATQLEPSGVIANRVDDVAG